MEDTESSQEHTKRRAPNYTYSEREHLLNIICNYKNIENKKTDGVSVKSKKETWQQIANEFNSTYPNINFRLVDSLKKFYEKQKEELRKRYANAKKELYKTGGGPETKFEDKDSSLLMSIMNQKTIKGLDSQFDSNYVPENNTENSKNIASTAQPSNSGNNEKELYKINECTAENNIEFVFEDDLPSLQPNSQLLNEEKTLQTPKRKLEGNIDKAYSSKNKSKIMSRRRPKAVVPLTSSRLGENYELLVERKLELVECLKKEHVLRVQSLELDIALKKKQLNINNSKDSNECILDSQMLF